MVLTFPGGGAATLAPCFLPFSDIIHLSHRLSYLRLHNLFFYLYLSVYFDQLLIDQLIIEGVYSLQSF